MSDSAVNPQRHWVGERVRRVEDPAMVTGATRYVSDVQIPRMLDVAFVRSSRAHARIVRIDVDSARTGDGVRLVLCGADLAGVPPIVDFVPLEGALKTPRPVLPPDRVRYVGEPIGAIVAESRYLAEDAVDAVHVEYEALAPDAPVHADLPDNRYFRAVKEVGEVADAFERAALVVRRRLRFQRLVASAMETLAIVADHDSATGELTCFVSTQMPHGTREGLALALGLPVSHVRVVCPAMGGAFGAKEVVLPEFICAAAAAMRLGRPVRWVEDRREALTAGAHGKEAETELEAAFDAEGGLLGMRGRFASDTGAYSSGIGAYVEFLVAANSVPGLYRLPSYEYDAAGLVSNKAPLSPFRGVGLTVSQTLRELVLDEAARGLGLDRMTLRRRNMADDGPWRTVLGEEYEAGSWRGAFERCLDLIDYEGFLRRQIEARADGRLLGIGLSPFVEPAAIGSGSTVGGLPGASYDSARVTVDITGKVEVALPTFSHGQGHHTTIAQITADLFGVAPQDVRVLDGDTARTPYGMGTFGSRSAVFATGTVSAAGTIVRDKVKEVAALLLEATPDDLELVDGAVGVIGVPASRIPLSAIAQAARYAPHVRAALDDPTLTATAFFDPPKPTHSNGTIGAIVEVDPETGAVTIERIVAVEDCGAMLNPMIVEGQIRGGIAQGIGLALLERYTYDESGQPLTTTFSDYLIPQASDIPRVLIEHLETPSPTSPSGVKGMAEGCATATPAAVICAVLDAIAPHGVIIESLPLTAERVAEALEATRTTRSH